MIFRLTGSPETWKAASSNLGGPKRPLASFEAATPSRGIPIKLLSSFPFEFSSIGLFLPGALWRRSWFLSLGIVLILSFNRGPQALLDEAHHRFDRAEPELLARIDFLDPTFEPPS